MSETDSDDYFEYACVCQQYLWLCYKTTFPFSCLPAEACFVLVLIAQVADF
jgi:hypothetical protein